MFCCVNRSFGFGFMGYQSFMSVRMGETLGAAIGRVVKVDCDPRGGCVREFLRIRVGIDERTSGSYFHMKPIIWYTQTNIVLKRFKTQVIYLW